MAQTVEHLKDEIKAMPVPQPLAAPGPDAAPRAPITLNAQWSAVPPLTPDIPASPEFSSAAYPFMQAKPSFGASQSGAPQPLPPDSVWGTAPPIAPTPSAQPPALEVFRDGGDQLSFDALPPDHWSRQVQPKGLLPLTPSKRDAPRPHLEPPPVLPDLSALHEVGEKQTRQLRKLSPLMQAALVVIALCLGVGISTFLFGRMNGSRPGLPPVSAEGLQDVELTGFRLSRVDQRFAQVRFLVVNHGRAVSPNKRIEVILHAGGDHDYTFRIKLPAVTSGECSEVSARIDAPPSIHEASDWQKLRPEYHVLD